MHKLAGICRVRSSVNQVGILALAGRKLEGRDPGVPSPPARLRIILGSVPERAVIHGVNAHGAVVSPA